MFSKKASSKNDQTPSSASPEAERLEPGIRDKTKSGPTPRRRDAEAANRVPLVPGDRRASAKEQRARNKVLRDRQYRALQTGDEAGLPARDKGPLRRYTRDFVDARRNIGEYFLIIAMVFMVLILFTGQSPDMAFFVTIALYSMVLLTIFDAWLMWRKLKGKLIEKFGPGAGVKGVRWYAVMRVFQLRRARLPKPQVKHGQYPS